MDHFTDIRQRLARVAPGVLCVERNRDGGGWDVYDIVRSRVVANVAARDEADLLAQAPDDLRRLLNEVDWLRDELAAETARGLRASAELAGLRAELNAWRNASKTATAIASGDVPAVTVNASLLRRLLSEGGE